MGRASLLCKLILSKSYCKASVNIVKRVMCLIKCRGVLCNSPCSQLPLCQPLTRHNQYCLGVFNEFPYRVLYKQNSQCSSKLPGEVRNDWCARGCFRLFGVSRCCTLTVQFFSLKLFYLIYLRVGMYAHMNIHTVKVFYCWINNQ